MPEPLVKKCKQCTIVKPIEQFRPYYGRKKKKDSRYLQCLTCESLNNAYAAAKRRDDATRLEAIEGIYNTYVELGGAVVRWTIANSRGGVDALISKLTDAGPTLLTTGNLPAWPIKEWLNHDFSVYDTHELFEIEDYLYGPLQEELAPKDTPAASKMPDATSEDNYNLIKARVEATRDVLNAAEEAAKATGNGY